MIIKNWDLLKTIKTQYRSYAAFGKQVGRSRQFVNGVVNGIHNMTDEEWTIWANGLDVDVDTIYPKGVV